MLAFSTNSCVYLIDYENEIRYNSKIDIPNVVFIEYIDIYIVLMQS